MYGGDYINIIKKLIVSPSAVFTLANPHPPSLSPFGGVGGARGKRRGETSLPPQHPSSVPPLYLEGVGG